MDSDFESFGSRMIVPTDGVWSFDILVVANNGTAFGDAGFQIKGVISNRGGSTLLRNVTTTVLFQDASASGWAITAEADATHSALVLKAAGGSGGLPVKWVASVRTVELQY